MDEPQQHSSTASGTQALSSHHTPPPTPALGLPDSHSRGNYHLPQLFHFLFTALPTHSPSPGLFPVPMSFRAGHPEDEVTSTGCHHPQPAALPVPEPTLRRHCCYCLASLLPGVSLCSPTRGHAALQLGAIQLCAHLQFPQNMSTGEAGRAGLHRLVLGPREPQLHTGLQSPSNPPAFG